MMKKRLLALALCLVMVSSLLPLTAAAFPSSGEMYSWAGGINHNGTYCGDIYITDASPEGFRITEVTGAGYSLSVPAASLGDGQWKLPASDEINTVSVRFSDDSTGVFRYLDFSITSKYSHTWSVWTSNGNGTHSRTCSNGCVDSPEIKPCSDTNGDHKCDVCNGCIHGWNFKAAGNTLTGHCPFCGKDVTLTLKADSVTLPNSPFNARLEGERSFKDVFTNAAFDDIRYDYEESEGVWNYGIAPISANAKPGNYQAFVSFFGLPGNVVLDGGEVNQNGEGYLYVKYTASDPKVTAQTGDDRPIEIMLVSALAFSALAAAAFILDSKRKYRQ